MQPYRLHSFYAANTEYNGEAIISIILPANLQVICEYDINDNLLHALIHATAPAPLITTLYSFKSLFIKREQFIMVAASTITVPC